MITIKNLRNSKPSEPYDVRVDRASVLGNPFYMHDESERDEVCDKYEEYMRAMWNIDTEYLQDKSISMFRRNKYCEAILNLVEIYKKYGTLRLYCWCAPKRCHAESIKRLVEEIVESERSI